MGRRRRTVRKARKRSLPKVFLCPECGNQALNILYMEKEALNRVICGKCGLRKEYTYNVHEEKIDVYCIFIDDHYKQ